MVSNLALHDYATLTPYMSMGPGNDRCLAMSLVLIKQAY